MKLSAYTFLIAVALLSDLYSVSSLVVSASRVEDTGSELDTPNALFLNEEVADNTFGVASSNGYPTLGSDGPGREGSSRIIIVADSGLWRGPKMAARSFPPLRQWDLGAGATPGNVLAVVRRDTNEDVASKVPIGRRDTMRCMVGRVYRPCWEV